MTLDIKFLNNEKNHIELSKNSVFELEEVKQEKLQKFRDEVLYCDELNTTAYKSLLKSLIPIDSVDYSKLNSEMAKILLDENLLELNSYNYDGLKSLNSNLHVSLIEYHIQSFIDEYISSSIEQKDWYLLLNSNRIRLSHKRQILHFLTINELSDSNVAKKVMEHHPDQKVEEYGFDEIKALLSHQGSLEGRISILLKYIDELSDDQLEAIVSQFGYSYKNLFGLWKSPKFPNNTAHSSLLKELDERGIISSFTKEGEKLRAHCRRK